jgi:NADH dehydrogenase
MKIAITGGTGFIGGHLAQDLVQRGHEVVLIARGLERPDPRLGTLEHATFVETSVTDTDRLVEAFRGCGAVVDCAGTSREDGHQTYRQVHVDGARSMVAAAGQAGVPKLVLLSFLRVRPGIRSTYHTTKWEGEEIVRQADIPYVVVKAGLVYGQGDHLLNRLGSLFRRMPVFATVGIRERTVRPIAVKDLVDVLRAAALDDRLSGQTVAVVGPEELRMSTVAKRVAKVMGKSIVVLPFPVAAQRLLAWFSERFMSEPLVSSSQIEMLADGISEPLADSQPLPEDLAPRTLFTDEQIREGLPA